MNDNYNTLAKKEQRLKFAVQFAPFLSGVLSTFWLYNSQNGEVVSSMFYVLTAVLVLWLASMYLEHLLTIRSGITFALIRKLLEETDVDTKEIP